MPKAPSKIFKFSLYILYILLTAELLTRAFAFFYPLEPEFAVPPSVGRFEAERGWGPRPSSVGYSTATGEKIEYRINSRGIRGRETPYEKPEGIFRLVILGDSRTFGYGVSQDTHYSTVLERHFKNVEVINMGVCGFGIDQELMTLQKEGMKYAPDLVLAYVAHFGNERHLKTKVFGKQKPRFILKDGKLELINYPVKYSVLKETHSWFRLNSRFYLLIVKLFEGSPVGAKETGPAAHAKKEKAPLTPEQTEELFAVGTRIVAEMDAAAKAGGAKFVLVTQLADLERRVKSLNIPVLNVSDLMGGTKYHLPNGLHHINDEGNSVLAGAIKDFLKENGFIPEDYRIADTAAGI